MIDNCLLCLMTTREAWMMVVCGRWQELWWGRRDKRHGFGTCSVKNLVKTSSGLSASKLLGQVRNGMMLDSSWRRVDVALTALLPQ